MKKNGLGFCFFCVSLELDGLLKVWVAAMAACIHKKRRPNDSKKRIISFEKVQYDVPGTRSEDWQVMAKKKKRRRIIQMVRLRWSLRPRSLYTSWSKRSSLSVVFFFGRRGEIDTCTEVNPDHWDFPSSFSYTFFFPFTDISYSDNELMCICVNCSSTTKLEMASLGQRMRHSSFHITRMTCLMKI